MVCEKKSSSSVEYGLKAPEPAKYATTEIIAIAAIRIMRVIIMGAPVKFLGISVPGKVPLSLDDGNVSSDDIGGSEILGAGGPVAELGILSSSARSGR